MAEERLQKLLARAGVSSRRGAEVLITEGRVSVDGQVVRELGAKADPRTHKIEVDGKVLQAERFVYVLFHKPREVVCTMHDPQGRRTVREFMRRIPERVVPVGRLDYHTSGVLLLTNDGDFAATLAHPKTGVKKTYVAKIRGVLDTKESIEAWRQPITVDGKKTEPAEVRLLRIEAGKTWIEVTLREGKNRHIHRLGEATGNTVFRLARLSFAEISSEGLRPGEWRYLLADELESLKKKHGVPKKIYPAPPLPNEKQIRRQRALGRKHVRAVSDGTPGKQVSRSSRRGGRSRR